MASRNQFPGHGGEEEDRCFLILFHCRARSMENGHSSMQSKTTVIHLNRMVHNNTVACQAQISTGLQEQGLSTTAMDRSNPPEISS